jgi:hypothetical protein
MKILITTFFLLLPQLIDARIGETRAQCDDRYGKIHTTRNNTVTYEDGEYIAQCDFWNGVCHFIMYVKGSLSKKEKLVIDDVISLLNDNGKNWRINEKFEMRDVMQWFSDKSIAIYISSDDTMSVTTKEYN